MDLTPIFHDVPMSERQIGYVAALLHENIKLPGLDGVSPDGMWWSSPETDGLYISYLPCRVGGIDGPITAIRLEASMYGAFSTVLRITGGGADDDCIMMTAVRALTCDAQGKFEYDNGMSFEGALVVLNNMAKGPLEAHRMDPELYARSLQSSGLGSVN
ncbi:MAG: hypothetical protein AB7G06_09450 [Bdellovibrionales bacterium]